ncbi:MAG: hypothetical protein HUJ76_12125, partial [Parasporobacterium sp.]|nr:hypothetical protein [Parasporobacterium sp.]
SKGSERYNIITDLYRIGAYDEHDRLADNLLAANGDLMTTVARLGEALKQGKTVTQNIFTQLEEANESARKNAAIRRAVRKTVNRKVMIKKETTHKAVSGKKNIYRNKG